MQAPTRESLIEYLVRTGIAGQVDTPRQNNLRHYRRLAEGDPYHRFGLSLKREWSAAEVLELMADRCGVIADPEHLWGVDTIDPDRTVDALAAVADRLAAAARTGERVMFATGHPGNLLEAYGTWRAALAERGAVVTAAGEGREYSVADGKGPLRRVVVWRDGVGHVSDGAEPRHSHHPDGMHAILADLAEHGRPLPDLVVADHGFAGAAAEAGIDVVGFADCNDPALFVAEAEGKVRVTVPLDDGYPAPHYRPLADYVLARAGLSAY